MKKIHLLLGLLVLSACSLQPIESGSRSSNLSIANNTNPDLASLCQQKGYTWHPADSSCRYEETTPELSIKIAYPIELLPSPLMETTLDSYIATYKANFLQSFEELYDPSVSPWVMDIRYQIYRHSPNILSVQVHDLSFTGGPHHNIRMECFTFDTAGSKILGFEDLFVEGIDPLPSLIPLVRASLVANMNAKGIPVDANDRGVIGGTSELSHFQNFALTETHLLIFFETHQVAGYVQGEQQAEIPLSDLESILKSF